MFTVIECIWQQHDYRLLVLAALTWIVGSTGFFLLLKRASECTPVRRRSWVATAALVGGIGVWSTHFISMLAYRGGMPMSFEFELTALSAVAAIGIFWLALKIWERGTVSADIGAALTATAGVSIMHFMGMSAIIVAAHIRYDPVLLSQGLAVTFLSFALAFRAFRQLKGPAQTAVAAGFAIVAVCSLHFTAMAATSLMPDPSLPAAVVGNSRNWLIGAITAISMTLILLTTAAAVVDRYLTDLHGLADATLEALVITHQGRIVEANACFGEMVGTDVSALLGQSPDAWLRAADGLPTICVRSSPVEAMLVNMAGTEKILEIAVNDVEYRGRQCQVIAIRDLTDKKQAQRQVEHMATHDALTGLPNRALFDKRLTHALMRAAHTGEDVALLAIDLDRFKAVNDIFGHAAGDHILCKVAAILQSATAPTDTVARIGGDEFMVLQTGSTRPNAAQALVAHIIAEVGREMDTARDPTAVNVSIGVAVYPRDATDAALLRHGADVALYRAKDSGRGTACFFDREMDTAVRERRALEHDLRHAITRKQLRLVYQALMSSDGRTISGYEALVRWAHPEHGLVLPDQFVPLAEETGVIIPLGEWVLREACRTAMRWDNHLSIAVNVSPVQFQLTGLASTVATILAETGLAASRLELEITESVLMKDRKLALSTLNTLKKLGVRIVMDDFGTGYSSLSNLQSFPFDKIKIDRSFVSAIEDDVAARSIIRAIVGIGRSLNLPVVAEGVETEAQRRMIVEEGCLHAQGFLWGRPGVAPTSRQASGESAAA
jgi:diguanylate cyclase (GGDEF)-like protein